MFKIVLWFICILITVPLLYVLDSYIRSILPGQSKSYILQPLYCLIKLFGKSSAGDFPITPWFSMGACWFSLAALYLTVSGSHFLLVISSLTLLELFILAGACSTKELSGTISARRGIARFIAVNFTSMIVAASLYRAAGTLNLDEIFVGSQKDPVLFQLPLAFASLFVVLLMKGGLLYFDFGITGKKSAFLDSGLYTPYSGGSLALMQLTHWVETGVWLKLVSAFLPGAPWLSFLTAAFLYLAMLLLDSFVPRTGWKRAARNGWIWAGGMAVTNFIWLYLL